MGFKMFLVFVSFIFSFVKLSAGSGVQTINMSEEV